FAPDQSAGLLPPPIQLRGRQAFEQQRLDARENRQTGRRPNELHTQLETETGSNRKQKLDTHPPWQILTALGFSLRLLGAGRRLKPAATTTRSNSRSSPRHAQGPEVFPERPRDAAGPQLLGKLGPVGRQVTDNPVRGAGLEILEQPQQFSLRQIGGKIIHRLQQILARGNPTLTQRPV